MEELKQKAIAEIGTLSSCGTWNSKDHFHFIKLWKEYQKIRDMKILFVERCHMEIPYKGKREIEEHLRWYLRFKSYKSQMETLRKNYELERDDFLITAKDIVVVSNNVEQIVTIAGSCNVLS